MNTKSDLIKPFLLKMCINNAEFGEWVINQQLLSLEVGKEQIKMLNDIIESRTSEKIELLFKVKKFILKEIKKGPEGLTDAQKKTLSLYIKLFHSILLKLKLSDSVVIDFSVKDLDNLVKLMS